MFRYTDVSGTLTDDANPNGSVGSIAGICSEQRNVVGLMPHPERACESVLGSADGLMIFNSVVAALTAGVFGARGSTPAVGPTSGAQGIGKEIHGRV